VCVCVCVLQHVFISRQTGNTRVCASSAKYALSPTYKGTLTLVKLRYLVAWMHQHGFAQAEH
jgi:hypothetical protein